MKQQNLVKKGAYWYHKESRGGPYVQRDCANCEQEFFGRPNSSQPTYGRFCSQRCSRLYHGGHPLKEGNPSWRGRSVTYISGHFRVYRYRGKAARCVWGCKQVARYEWANMTGDYANPDDYVEMCAKCHRRFDSAVRKTSGSSAVPREDRAETLKLRENRILTG